ncbi:GNAT family N-acetyltransferase [Chitinolyticbacter meiyuanensis]|uniref:GNAT family N-acetyltransferase n=1 Tax=Chitinolyticbacter meiyuanensis TaxID=682798 RepID=UPI0011E5B372|nr:GNAT family N-acetyltransferase [Chitinolyticbacter meiyuanensis]
MFVSLTTANIADHAPLYCTVFNAPPWCDGWSEAAARERLQHFAAFPRFVGLALHDGATPIALVFGWGERWIDHWSFHLKELCVAPQVQGQGHGQRLLAEFEHQLAAVDYGEAFLMTGAVVPARDFYQRNGYRTQDLVVMGKPLSA